MEVGNTCEICYRVFTSQMIGRINSCNHEFCLECILRSSKIQNICPLDRGVYQVVQATHGGEVVAEFKMENIKRKRSAPERYDFTCLCEICKRDSRRKGCLILCDACNLGFHLSCLKPPLKKVPAGEWYCSLCSSVMSKSVMDKEHVKSKENLENYKTKEEMRQNRDFPNKKRELESASCSTAPVIVSKDDANCDDSDVSAQVLPTLDCSEHSSSNVEIQPMPVVTKGIPNPVTLGQLQKCLMLLPGSELCYNGKLILQNEAEQPFVISSTKNDFSVLDDDTNNNPDYIQICKVAFRAKRRCNPAVIPAYNLPVEKHFTSSSSTDNVS